MLFLSDEGPIRSKRQTLLSISAAVHEYFIFRFVSQHCLRNTLRSYKKQFLPAF